MKNAMLVLLLPAASSLFTCRQDGTSYTYSERVAAPWRTTQTSHCPNHPNYDINPNVAMGEESEYSIPLSPMYDSTRFTDLSYQGGLTGVARSGAQIFSPYAAVVALTGFATSAPALEGDTFDACGGHASSDSSPTLVREGRGRGGRSGRYE